MSGHEPAPSYELEGDGRRWEQWSICHGCGTPIVRRRALDAAAGEPYWTQWAHA